MPNEKWRDAINDRQEGLKKVICDILSRTPILQLAFEKASISRSTYDRWREQDENFRQAVDSALKEGRERICDYSESKLLELVGDKHFPAIMAYLRAHRKEYGNKVEITGSIQLDERPLTAEEQAIFAELMRFAGLPVPEKKDDDKQDQQNHGQQT